MHSFRMLEEERSVTETDQEIKMKDAEMREEAKRSEDLE